ncbi:hypothetical protein Cgig2_031987 [Carnegiea gigantea]|uniref:Uncharacterized protein n=1 Tax=Carnegiea gigantea TaxID=171969 RepID=A0A9Q1JMF0_9CARY|nr:hypothetical protein Cgig2_031987 [Carnegiea gigantea]
MMFGGKDAPRFASPYNGPLVVEMKIGSAIVRQILIFTGSSVDIITWDYLKKLAHLGHDIVPMTNPILGFGGQKVRPLGMIRLPVRFGDKARFKSLEDDFLVVNVPTAYNLIIGRLTLHRQHHNPLQPHSRQEIKASMNEKGWGTTRQALRHPRDLSPRTLRPQLPKDWWPRPQQLHSQTNGG